jgi:hypothetical protein
MFGSLDAGPRFLAGRRKRHGDDNPLESRPFIFQTNTNGGFILAKRLEALGHLRD